jgi:hypothetical protein
MEGHSHFRVLFQNRYDIMADAGKAWQSGMQIQSETHPGEFMGRKEQIIVNREHDVPRAVRNGFSHRRVRFPADIPYGGYLVGKKPAQEYLCAGADSRIGNK